MIISIDAQKVFDFIITVLEHVELEVTCLNIIGAIYGDPTANIILNRDKLG